MPDQGVQPSQVLAFWFTETQPLQWFAKDPAFDALVGERFLGLTRQAIAGELDTWSAEPTGALALVLLGHLTDPRTADFARRHRDVIARFGRFPNRNAALGRVSSAEELAFLQTPGSRF